MKNHWDTINRILSDKGIYSALKTHAKMRNDEEPTKLFLELSIAIHMVMPKRYRGKYLTTQQP